MSGLFRSEEMCLCQLYMQTESAYSIMSELGELSVCQFRDLNPSINLYQRKYVSDVRRCEELERKLAYLKSEMNRYNVISMELDHSAPAPKSGEIGGLETSIERTYNRLKEMDSSTLTLRKSHAQSMELAHILQWTNRFFQERLHPTDGDVLIDQPEALVELASVTTVPYKGTVLNGSGTTGSETSMEQVSGTTSGALSCLCGIVNAERVDNMERVLWRSSRGNVFFRWIDIGEIDDPDTGEPVQKCVFIMFFPGTTLEPKLRNICKAFHATVHPCLQNDQARRDMSTMVNTQLKDMETVLRQSKDHRYGILLLASSKYEYWLTQVRKAKAVFHTMNMLNLDLTQKAFIAECWIAVSELDKVKEAVNRGTTSCGSTVSCIINRLDTSEIPPTYNKVNKFTGPWQEIINAYGYGSYREINPTLFTLVTFPFLFAVMYGDAGHGMIVMLFSSAMCIWEKKLGAMKIREDIFNTFFKGRYVLLSLGLFSIYTGSIYNEIFSKSVNAFGSVWRVPYSPSALSQHPRLTLDPNSTSYLQYPYPYGFDPVWSMASNKLNFQNSFKMKISVIFGVIQMVFGVLLSLVNYRYFQNYLDIFSHFLPQLLFLCCIFLYLVILIIYKWIAFNVGGTPMAVGYYPGSHCAPNLLVGLINMFMFTKRQEGFQGANCFNNLYYPDQGLMEKILIIVALLCVPWMLLVKPIVLKIRHEKKKKMVLQADVPLTPLNGDGGPSTHSGHQIANGGHKRGVKRPQDMECDADSGDEFNMTESLITSAIHTVEFCLGLVSHTASYLRLWALSLAHSELADVLWTMVMRMAFKSAEYTGSIMVYFIFFAFASLTIAILVFMDALSVFLHALRLHWVEFQSKFYDGQGHGFHPFSFKEILALAEGQDRDADNTPD